MRIMSTNFAKMLVWKHEYDDTNTAHQIQMTTICHWMTPPSMKIFCVRHCLDHLIVEMEERFFDQKQKCRSLWGLIPTVSTAMLRQTLLEI